MRENIDLIRNINQLRKKLKEIKFNHKSLFFYFRWWKLKNEIRWLSLIGWKLDLALVRTPENPGYYF